MILSGLPGVSPLGTIPTAYATLSIYKIKIEEKIKYI